MISNRFGKRHSQPDVIRPCRARKHGNALSKPIKCPPNTTSVLSACAALHDSVNTRPVNSTRGIHKDIYNHSFNDRFHSPCLFDCVNVATITLRRIEQKMVVWMGGKRDGLGTWPMAGFGISGVEHSGYALRVLRDTSRSFQKKKYILF
jgi:hypothetical protein